MRDEHLSRQAFRNFLRGQLSPGQTSHHLQHILHGCRPCAGLIRDELSRKQGMIEGYLVQSSEGPARKYYRMTEDGRATLDHWRNEWRTFSSSVDEVLNGGVK